MTHFVLFSLYSFVHVSLVPKSFGTSLTRTRVNIKKHNRLFISLPDHRRQLRHHPLRDRPRRATARRRGAAWARAALAVMLPHPVLVFQPHAYKTQLDHKFPKEGRSEIVRSRPGGVEGGF